MGWSVCPYCDVESVRKDPADVFPAGYKGRFEEFFVCPECKARAPASRKGAGPLHPLMSPRQSFVVTDLVIKAKELARKLGVSKTLAMASLAVEAGVRSDTRNFRIYELSDDDREVMYAYAKDLEKELQGERAAGKVPKYLVEETVLGEHLETAVKQVVPGISQEDMAILLSNMAIRLKPFRIHS